MTFIWAYKWFNLGNHKQRIPEEGRGYSGRNASTYRNKDEDNRPKDPYQNNKHQASKFQTDKTE